MGALREEVSTLSMDPFNLAIKVRLFIYNY